MKAMGIRLFFMVVIISCFLYVYVQKQNEITKLRLTIPQLAKEFKEIEDENIRLKYEIETFESPPHLMELSRKAEYRHLHQPRSTEIVTLIVPSTMREKNR